MTGPLADLNVLVVEDNYLIGSLIEDVLTAAGFGVSGPFPRLTEAIEAASIGAYHAALLDINLHGEQVFPVADILSRQKVPYLFVTGYGHGMVPPEHSDRPRLTTPFKAE
jgi:DNA-binding response OmpR family regulator